MSRQSEDREVTFEIVEELGVLSRRQTGWAREINLVSWNGGAVKYDIRDWDQEHEHMSRGITLYEKELEKIVSIFCERKKAMDGAGEENANNYQSPEPLQSAQQN